MDYDFSLRMSSLLFAASAFIKCFYFYSIPMKSSWIFMLENEREKICIYVRTTLVHWVHTYIIFGPKTRCSFCWMSFCRFFLFIKCIKTGKTFSLLKTPHKFLPKNIIHTLNAWTLSSNDKANFYLTFFRMLGTLVIMLYFPGRSSATNLL